MALTRKVLAVWAGAVLAGACLGAGGAGETGGVAVVATAPATSTAPAAASAEQMKQWVAQLGAEDFKVRSAAAKSLTAAGKEALPALREGAGSDDPEVKAESQKLIAKIEGGDSSVATATPGPGQEPGLVVGPGQGGVVRIGGGGGGGGMIIVQGGGQIVIHGAVAVAAGPKGKEVNVEENGKKIHISETADGIVVSVTEEVDGKDKETKYEAKDAKELEEKQPEGYKIYKKYIDQKAGAIHIQQQFIVRPGGVQIQPAPAQPEEEPKK